MYYIYLKVVYFIISYKILIYRFKGLDCGIVNVNIFINGVEIGGAFGMCINVEKYFMLIRFFEINIICDIKFYIFFRIIVIIVILKIKFVFSYF